MAVITVYANARSPTPAACADLPWPELAAQLEALANEPTAAAPEADIEEQKKRMVAWSPHALREGATRCAEGVDHVSLLVVDVDHGATPSEIVAYLHEQQIAALVYESAKSTLGAPRFRVVCPVTAPIAPEACRETRTRFAELLGLPPDCGVLTAIEASKLFFSGRAHGTPPRRVWITEGAPVDVATLPPNSTAWAERVRAAVATPLAELPPADQGLVAALGPWQQHAGRKWSVCGAVGGVMRKLGYAPAACESVIRAWLADAPADVDVYAGVSWALGAWARAAEDVSGFQELERLLGAAHAQVVHQAAYAGTWAARAVPRHDPFSPVPSAGDPFADLITTFDVDEPLVYVCEALRLVQIPGKIVIVGGDPGVGKGPLVDHVAVCLALGVPAFGRYACTATKVLILDIEGARLTKRRLRRLALGMGLDPRELAGRVVLLDASRRGDLRDTTFLAWLAAYVVAEGVGAVIVDSYTSAMLATEEDPFKNGFASLAKLLALLPCLVVAIAHARKPAKRGDRPTLADISGNAALGAMASTGISIWRPDENDMDAVCVGCMRAPEEGFAQFDLRFSNTANGGLALSIVTHAEKKQDMREDGRTVREMMANRVLAAFRRAPTVPRLARSLRADAAAPGDRSASPTTLEPMLKGLVRAGVLREEPYHTSEQYFLTDTTITRITFDGTNYAAVRGDEPTVGVR